MKIGIFTDFYHPSTNGVVFVVDILHKNLKKLGHDVVIVAPRPGLRARKSPQIKGVKVIWIPAVEGLLFDEYLASIFSPSRVEKKLEKEELDVIIITTPGQISLLGVYIAKRMNIPIIQQYSTDLVMYVNHYKSAVPAMFALSLVAPFALKLKLSEIINLTKSLAKRPAKDFTFRQETASNLLVALHNASDCIIAVSEKSANQLKGNKEIRTPIYTLPTGVDKLPKTNRYSRKSFGIPNNNIIFLSVGRVTKEKNIELIIESFGDLASKKPNSTLLIVGDSSYMPKLKKLANESINHKNIIFTGKIDHKNLSDIYSLADVFVFASLTDTQGLVLNEASHNGLPFVWCDKGVNAVVGQGINGILAKPNKNSFAKAMYQLADNSDLRKQYSKNSLLQAQKFSELSQTRKLLKIINSIG